MDYEHESVVTALTYSVNAPDFTMHAVTLYGVWIQEAQQNDAVETLSGINTKL